MARTYEVEGTKTFLYCCIGAFLLAVWHLKDGWWPGEGYVLKHGPAPEDFWGMDALKPESKGGGYDSFYTYNRVTAILGFIAAVVCGYVHKVVR